MKKFNSNLVFDLLGISGHNYILFLHIGTDGTSRYLYNQLWKLCAGSLFDLPIIGEQVYYFPQGHIEEVNVSINNLTLFRLFFFTYKLFIQFYDVIQLVASENDNLCQLKPIFDISSKIKCNVINIKLKVWIFGI